MHARRVNAEDPKLQVIDLQIRAALRKAHTAHTTGTSPAYDEMLAEVWLFHMSSP
jgi:hypothetical protein